MNLEFFCYIAFLVFVALGNIFMKNTIPGSIEWVFPFSLGLVIGTTSAILSSII